MIKKTFARSALLLSTMFLLSSCAPAAPATAAPTPAETAPAETEADAEVVTTFEADSYMDRLEGCVSQIRAKTDFVPDIVVVLGSGLGDFADEVEAEAVIPYEDIKGLPESTAPGHEGQFVFGTLAGKKVVVMQGRVHYYEGYSVQDVVLPLRVLHMLGANSLILTNAVGAINETYEVGDFVAIRDHISSFVPSPLVGENIDELGERFTDMTAVYDRELLDLIDGIAREKEITVHRGVFIQVTGPQYETPTEIRMFRGLGADTVGMSTAVEAIAANHMGMRICAISNVTNMAAGMTDVKITSEEVNANAENTKEDFEVLLRELIGRM